LALTGWSAVRTDAGPDTTAKRIELRARSSR